MKMQSCLEASFIQRVRTLCLLCILLGMHEAMQMAGEDYHGAVLRSRDLQKH